MGISNLLSFQLSWEKQRAEELCTFIADTGNPARTILHFANGQKGDRATRRHYQAIFMVCCLPAEREIHKQPLRARLQEETQTYPCIAETPSSTSATSTNVSCTGDKVWEGGALDNSLVVVAVAVVLVLVLRCHCRQCLPFRNVSTIVCDWSLICPGPFSPLPCTRFDVVNNSLAQGHNGIAFSITATRIFMLCPRVSAHRCTYGCVGLPLSSPSPSLSLYLSLYRMCV